MKHNMYFVLIVRAQTDEYMYTPCIQLQCNATSDMLNCAADEQAGL